MNLLIWIIFGALTGWLASILMGTSHKQGALGNILVGILGAFVGGFTLSLFGFAGVTGFNFYSIFVAILGGALVISLSRLILK